MSFRAGASMKRATKCTLCAHAPNRPCFGTQCTLLNRAGSQLLALWHRLSNIIFEFVLAVQCIFIEINKENVFSVLGWLG